MGNSVKFGEVIDAKIQESKNLCSLGKSSVQLTCLQTKLYPRGKIRDFSN